MNLYLKDRISMEEYFEIRERSDEILEYIDGFVYMSPSPSTKHQRVLGKLFLKLGNFFEGKPCEVFPEMIIKRTYERETGRTNNGSFFFYC